MPTIVEISESKQPVKLDSFVYNWSVSGRPSPNRNGAAPLGVRPERFEAPEGLKYISEMETIEPLSLHNVLTNPSDGQPK